MKLFGFHFSRISVLFFTDWLWSVDRKGTSTFEWIKHVGFITIGKAR